MAANDSPTVSTTAASTDSSTDPSPFDELLTMLYDARSSVSSPAVSPDGTRIACVVSTVDLDENTTRSRVWLVGPDHAAAPITAGPYDTQPVWSPDGRSLAFTSRRGEPGRPGASKEATLHVLPIAGPGEVRTVATLPEGFADVRWSPDGRWFAFCSRTRDERYAAKDESWQPPRKIETFFTRLNDEGWIFDRPSHVYVVAADGTGTPRNLTPAGDDGAPYEHSGVSWLPDSSAVVTSAGRHPGWDRDLAVDLYVVPLDGEMRALTAQTGSYGSPSVSPDGARVAFVGSDEPGRFPQNAKVGVIGIDGGAHEWISSDLDRTFGTYFSPYVPQWTDDATILALAEDRGDTHLFELRADGSQAPAPLTHGTITVGAVSAAGGTIALTQSRAEHPAELVTLTDGAITPLTSVAKSWSGWEKFAVPCTDGSGEIDAWIMRPADFDPAASYPVLLNVHGGPFTQYGEYFFDEAQMQAAAGFVVVMCNPRGSSGREIAWGEAINGPKHPTHPGTGWGTVDVDDVLAVLDHALATYDFCDASRVGMLGGSYGGYMATKLAALHGERFTAICSERAVNNWLSQEYSGDIATFFRGTMGPSILDDPDEYWRMSPIRHVREIDVPMLIIHSEDDLRCPIAQAEELFVALRLLDKDVTFYRFPAENHELSRSGSPVHRKQRGEIILEWFTDKLKEQP